jgi:hypothetical protein
MSQKILPTLLVCFALLAGYFAPNLLELMKSETHSVDLDDYCMLSTLPCKNNDVTLVIEHDVIKPLEPTQIFVVWPDTKAKSLALKIRGLEMDMGVTKFRLDGQGNGQFEGEIMLPVCTLDAMTWYGQLSDGQKEVQTALRMKR